MQLNGFELSILLIVLEDLLGALHVLGASHQDMTLVIIGLKLFDGRSCNRLIGSLLIEFDDSPKTDGIEVALFLGFPKWEFEDDLSVERLAILPERRGSELQDSALSKPYLKSAPRRCFSVMGLSMNRCVQ